MVEHTCDTIIIGAGLAGLSAARSFEQYNSLTKKAPVNYVVLEADSKIGGRAQSESVHMPQGGNIIINKGPQWFHRDLRADSPENALLTQAKECGTLVHDDMPRQFWIKGQQANYSGNIKLINTARNVIDHHNGPDVDLASLFTTSRLGTSTALSTTFGEVETGAPLREVSTVDVRELVACNRGEFLKEGLSHFVDHYARKVKPQIKVTQAVKKIKWNTEGVELTVANGDVYKAKNVILTVSIGVLKSGAITFEPPLPAETRENLSHISMGNFNKVFLFFDNKFRMPVNSNTHLDVQTKSGHDLFYLARDNGQQLVTTFLGGDMARLCDSDPERAKETAIQGLSEIWGDHIRAHITGAQVTQWGNNDLVKGGYSRVEIGHHHIREKLAQPIGGVLFPAGEALGTLHPESGRNWATHMTGATLSGERAARLIIQGVEKEHEKPGYTMLRQSAFRR